MSTALHRPAFADPTPVAGVPGFFSPRRFLLDFWSFEGVMVAYLYSNAFQTVLPKLPVDATVVLFALSIALAGVIVLREGLYLPGLLLALSFVPFLAWYALSWAWSPSKIYAPKSIMLMSTVNWWNIMAAGMIIAHDRERVARFFKLVLVPSVVVAGMGLYIYARYGSFKFAGWDWDEVGRVYNEWGRGVANGAIVLLFMCLRSRFLSTRQIVLAALLLFCGAFVFLSSSRSALLVFAVPACFLFLVYSAPVGREGLAISRAQLILLTLGLAAVAGITFLLSSGIKIDSLNRLLRVVDQAENTEIVLGANRWAYYGAAINYFLLSPIVGHGVRSFSVLFRGQELEGSHPHNMVLELLTDTGMVGLILFSLLILMALRRVSLRRLRADPLLMCATMFLIGRTIAAMLGTELNGQYYLFFAIGLMAVRPPVAAAEAAEGEGEAAGEAEGAPPAVAPPRLAR